MHSAVDNGVQDQPDHELREPSLFWSAMPLVVLVILLAGGYGYLHLKTEPLLLLAAIFTGCVAKGHGLTFDDMMEGIKEKINMAMPAILVLISVGILIGTWMISGTIPMMIYYGIKLVSAKYIVLVSFVIAAIVSIVTGTSWGAVGSIGVALIGIATGLGVSLPATAGAVVAGAYFGDKLSPLSDTTNLAPIAAGTDLWTHIRHMLWTTVPATIVALTVYFVTGLRSSGGDASSQRVAEFSAVLTENFHFNAYLWLPLVIVLGCAAAQLPILPTILGSSIVAGAFAMIFQGASLQNVFLATTEGFTPEMLGEGTDLGQEMNNLLSQGGMASMASVTLLAFCAFGFAGILSAYGALDTIIEALLGIARRTGDVILATVLSCITVAFATGSSYLSIIVPGELFRDAYAKRGLDARNLSRTLEDSGTVIVPLIPWSAAGVYMSGVLGVSVTEYAPWAVFCYTGFIFAILWGYLGVGITRTVQPQVDDAHQQ